MVLFLNPYAAGGTALKKWNSIESEFCRKFNPANVFIINSLSSLKDQLAQVLHWGEQDLVAAGGDGTLNSLVNYLCAHPHLIETTGIRLGALGLGSSNDFHKPFKRQSFIYNIPCKADFSNISRRDIGSVSFEQDGQEQQRFFLINASCGVTAEANYFFNHPSFILHFLKRYSTNASILYAVIRTILLYKNFACTLRLNNNRSYRTNLTNLAILKSPHVSGSFLYDTPVSIDDGSFAINLSEHMSKIDLIHLLFALSHGKFMGLRHTQTWFQSEVMVTSPKTFAVEFDGEVINTKSVHFRILPKYLQVCL